MSLLLLFVGATGGSTPPPPEPIAGPTWLMRRKSGPSAGISFTRKRYDEIVSEIRAAEQRARELKDKKKRNEVLAAAKAARAVVEALNDQKEIDEATNRELRAMQTALEAIASSRKFQSALSNAAETMARAHAIRQSLEDEDEEEAIALLLLLH